MSSSDIDCLKSSSSSSSSSSSLSSSSSKSKNDFCGFGVISRDAPYVVFFSDGPYVVFFLNKGLDCFSSVSSNLCISFFSSAGVSVRRLAFSISFFL